MTVSSIKVKVVRRAQIKLKVLPRFPANVAVGNFLTVTKANGTYTFGVDYTVLTPGPITDPTTAYIALLDATAGTYKEVSLSSLLTSGLDADLQAIAALTGTGILARTAANTWVLRAITGTANEITVANGDGVAGAPTLSLPAALTFTGKTVTGGTFNSPALVAPALGTPASGVATNLTGTASGLTSGNVTTNANLTGNVTSVGNATTIAANAVTNAKMATMAALTLKGNATAGSAVPTDIDITALTSKPSPVSADIVLIQDSAASNAFKKTTVGALASAGSVGSYNGRTGSVTATGTDVPLRSYLSGLTLSTAGATSTFGVAVGVATDSTNVSMMALASAYTKTTSAWALGTGVGSLDTGTVAINTGYHAYVIQRPDTGVVDVLISLSATAPTLPTNYTLFRRLGWMWVDGTGAWALFTQLGDEFLWSAPVNDINVGTLGTTATLFALRLPTGVKVNALWRAGVSASTTIAALINSPDEASIAGGSLSAGGNGNVSIQMLSTALVNSMTGGNTRTNTSAQIRAVATAASTTLVLSTYGWIDRRGRDQ